MRPVLGIVALLASAGFFTHPGQEQLPKNALTDEAIINTVGDRLFKMFARFGTPEEIHSVRIGDVPETDIAILEYHGAFAFGVRGKTVGIAYFFPGWKGKIKGFNLGDSREQVVKALGNEHEQSETENDDGVYDLKWDLKEAHARLWVIFDKNEKAKSVTVELK